MTDDRKSSPVPVRFDDEESEMLQSVSERTGLPQAQIVRLALKTFLREVQRTGTLPLEVKWESTKNGAIVERKNSVDEAASNIGSAAVKKLEEERRKKGR